MHDPTTRHPSSYRDPSGFLFRRDGILYRQVNQLFKEDFDHFISSGLYHTLVEKKLLIPHRDVSENLTGMDNWYRTIEPSPLPFVSFPFEWCFDMWKDAALLTLALAREAMNYGMMLKDASAYNVQWYQGKMTFIDTLSFEQYHQRQPWIAYRQYCEHFAAPLALMHYLKEPLQPFLLAYPDGIPLPLAKKLLPFKSRFNLNAFLHLHLHGNMAVKPAKDTSGTTVFSATSMKNLLRSLEEMTGSFSMDKTLGVWSGYYEEAVMREDYLQQKKTIISEWLQKLVYKRAIDAGANEGTFSLMAAEKGAYVISADFDHYSVNRMYRHIREKNIINIHPVYIDLSHPTPAYGLNNEERNSFIERLDTDLVLALALIHHLAIGKNILFEDLARMFRKMGKTLIIEFVPREDEKVKLMLQHKKDVYNWYTMENFLKAFSSLFNIVAEAQIGSSNRTVYLMQSHEI